MDQTRFLEACRQVMDRARQRQGIGTLGEKTLHAVLKQYYEPLEENREVRIGPYVADIRGEQGIVEIQTSGFDRLRAKLDLFLAENTVTVVYPVPAQKWLIWLDEDGVATPRRKSPKRATPCEVLPELYKIKPLLAQPNLRLCIPMLEVEEYRLKNGWSADGKRGSTRFERMPVTLEEEIWIKAPEEYGALVPQILPEAFTSKEFAKAAGLSPRKTSVSLNVLHAVGAVERIGKQGRAYLYRRTKTGRS